MDREGGFFRLVKFLRPHGEVITYDRRGYAKSLSAPGDRDVATHVRDLRDIIGAEPSIVIGHSLGGAIALSVAGMHESNVRGVVAYEPPMSWESWWTGRTVDDTMRSTSSTADAAEAFMRRFVGDERWSRLPQRTKDARRAEGTALVAETVSLRLGCPWDPESIECPVIAGCGERSRPDFRRSARSIGRMTTDSRVVEIPDAHHNAHSASPERFFEDLVRPLLNRLDSGMWDDQLSDPPPITV
jgi:pimeloyl-ACP methyl ester carboxylesterase